MPRRPPKKSVAFRFNPRTLTLLKARAHEVGSSQGALAERYVVEGIRRDDHPLIDFRDGAGGRRATVVGTRVEVGSLVETVRQNESSVEQTAAYLEIPEEHVEAALRYYAEYKREVDEWRARQAAVAARERERAELRREVLA